MSLTERQIYLVQFSFEKIEPIADIAAELFYARLFEMHPTLNALFRGDMKEQGRKLMNMLSVAVRGLNQPEQLLPAVRNLGVRHASYGIRPEHYAVVGQALLWTLEQGLGREFTPEVRDAWAEVYTLVATTMMKASYTEEQLLKQSA